MNTHVNWKMIFLAWKKKTEMQYKRICHAKGKYLNSRIKNKQKVIRYHISLNKNKEGHYRQMIMLFTKWRNEKVDFLYGCSSYEDSYLKMRSVIEATKTRYMKIGS